MTHASRALQSHDLSGEGFDCGSHAYFFTTQGHGGPPRMREKLNAGTTSETTQTCKTRQPIHSPIHANKANMEGWLWRPNNIRGPCGSNASWHLSCRWGTTPTKTSPGKPILTGNRTRARCVTGAYATACSTAVDLNICLILNSGFVINYCCIIKYFVLYYYLTSLNFELFLIYSF